MPRASSLARRAVPLPAAGWTAPPPRIDLGQLIGRTPCPLDRDCVAGVLTGKRVLITGAGGSIGSHLAHVASEFDPQQVILMERAENALFEVDRQLARRFPAVARRAILHDVVDREQTARLVADIAPHVVFHAAAHKHVPLMEDHPAHAVINNLFGTASIADASLAAGAERFVMISSDKAVNPSSVMGATKRLAEIYIAHLARVSAHPPAPASGPSAPGPAPTRFSVVRFGNVLGSAGSVLNIWSSQIADGGPVTVTDPRMTRYFMTIPEAAGLVIASGTLDERPSGAVYVLDMGAPIRIVELAARFVRAHGFAPRFVSPAPADPRRPATPEPSLIALIHEAVSPDAEPGLIAPVADDRFTMDIVFSGARPGEKIHEQLAYAAESLTPTSHPGINCWAGDASRDPIDQSDRADIPAMLAEFTDACARHDHAAVYAALRAYIPTIRPGRPE